MVDNASIATKSALQATFSSASSLPLLVPSSAVSHVHFPGASPQQQQQPHSGGGGAGGMKLEAVMENLQRQQAARLALEEKLRQAERDGDFRAAVETHMQQQALAFRRYHASVRGALAGAGAPGSAERHRLSGVGVSGGVGQLDLRRPPQRSDTDEEVDAEELEEQENGGEDDDDDDLGEGDSLNEGGMEEEMEGVEGVLGHYPARLPLHSPSSALPLPRLQQPQYVPAPRQPGSPSGLSAHTHPQQHEWTYEEQFKQSGKGSGPERKLGNSSVAFGDAGGSSSLIQKLYELDDDEKRKEFLDDLFSFMQKRGTPVNRIPIMAKQVLDLYTLYKLVTEKGGLVEVINKKIWREITKGLNLPTSITSAAFTLRTQYMKYLYPYECEKRGLSSPGELQAAIDSNRREGRRQSYGSALFNYSPVGTPTLLPSPKLTMPHISMPSPNGAQMAHTPVIKKGLCSRSYGIPPLCSAEDSVLAGCLTNRVGIPVSLAGHHGAAAQAAAAQAAAAAAVQAAALEQLREKLEAGEPPEKKVMLMAEEQQRIMQHALQHNLFAMATQLPMNIKLNNRDDRQETALNLSTNGISSINMSIEINGVVYTGVLFARKPAISVMPGSQRAQHHAGSQGKSNSPGLSSHLPPSSSSSSSSSSFHGPAASP
ncbi:AT-rich interactive domain-containing protein 3A isoform X1 [Astyanax mexicanus]|uniref:AT-rich interactive domain-containing protein 3A isoform X1 n=1 Tax=Astyanax mexicanus TaxID=7994 RepID=UPI0020CB3401|nr:AT-rich interactive domain-containing protein 3A isoform X1 [Astyanax mexicanus]